MTVLWAHPAVDRWCTGCQTCFILSLAVLIGMLPLTFLGGQDLKFDDDHDGSDGADNHMDDDGDGNDDRDDESWRHKIEDREVKMS